MQERAGDDGLVGAMVAGDLFEWGRRDAGRLWLAYPEADLSRHGVVVGAAGSGKTETLLRLSYLAARVYGWQVVFLDAKGDTATRERFVAAMLQAGIDAASIRTFPAQPYDGWRGDARALVNRLMEVSDFGEPYYREMALRVLDLATSAPPGPPGSSTELLGRLRKPALRMAYRARPEAAEIDDLAERDVAGVANRYRAFFGALGGSLDGAWAFEDAAACYLLLEGLALKAEAARLGRFFLEDFAHYAGVRKAQARRVLLVVDEFSALESAADAAHLFERLRSFGAAVIVSAQGYAGLGAAADRILDAAETLVLHRCADPERLVARAGTVPRVEHTRYLPSHAVPPGAGREGSVTRREGWRVRPNDVRQLPAGEAIVISGGKAGRVRVERLLPADELRAAAAEIVASHGATERPAPVFHPSPPPQVPGL
ncbi:MAG TPA: type IV secretion system DNA-binding domain-containing protein [Actinomycetota bacterium]